MRRPAHVLGGTYYLTLSGVSLRVLIDGADDTDYLGSLIARAVHRGTVLVHAYCWLPRELHLAMDLLNGSLPSFVRSFAAPFAKSKNRRTNYLGPLFAPGYGAILIYTQTHLVPFGACQGSCRLCALTLHEIPNEHVR